MVKKIQRKTFIGSIILMLIIILLVIFNFYLYFYYPNQFKGDKNGDVFDQITDNKKIVQIQSIIKNRIDTPDEQPEVYVIKDTAQLDSIIFYKNAKPNDLLLVYPKASRAILYSYDDNRIINVAKIHVGKDLCVQTAYNCLSEKSK